jgi:L-2-hydroxyglutarate oxidase LhgO
VHDGYDVAIVGGGVVGCAIAATLAHRGRSVVVLEASSRLGDGVTSRNSGVIHSGLYYPIGSLKAATCVRGHRLLYEWAVHHGVPFAKPGKLVVARDADDMTRLEALADNARAAGAPGVELVGQGFMRQHEPTVPGIAALWCPHTGIVDPYELTRSFAADAERTGATIVTNARVVAIEASYRLETTRGDVRAQRVVNAAGLHADEVARLAGVDRYRVYPWRGDYFRLVQRAEYRHLVYSVPKVGAAGLGIHLTIDLAGACRLGPDVEYVTSKHDHASREDKLPAFVAAARDLLGLPAGVALAWDSCGLRPKLRAPTDPDDKDFVVAEDLPGFVTLAGIESPGLTAALALGEHVAAMVD